MWRRCVAIACHPLATTVDKGLQRVFSVGDWSRRRTSKEGYTTFVGQGDYLPNYPLNQILTFLYMLGELGHLVSFLIPLLDTKSVSSQSNTLLVIYPIQGTKQQWVLPWATP